MGRGSSAPVLACLPLMVACHHDGPATAPASSPAPTATSTPTPTAAPNPVATVAAPAEPAPPVAKAAPAAQEPQFRGGVVAACSAADWSARSLPSLLAPGKVAKAGVADQPGTAQVLFMDDCTDAPQGPNAGMPPPVGISGVGIKVAEKVAA